MRRPSALALVAALLLSASGAEAQLYTRPGQLSQSWTCALTAIAATLTQCQAAPAVPYRLYITDIKVQSTTTTTGTYAIQSGTGTNCATGTTALFPASGVNDRFSHPPTTTAMADIQFTTPIRPAAGHAICVIGVATNTTRIQLAGFTAP